jgi:hypothetical protein
MNLLCKILQTYCLNITFYTCNYKISISNGPIHPYHPEHTICNISFRVLALLHTQKCSLYSLICGEKTMLVYSDRKMYYLRAKTELIQCMSGVFAVCWTFPLLIWNILIICMVKNMFYIKIIISGTHWFRHNWNFYTRICETNFAQSAVWRSRYDQWNWKCW